MSFKRKWKPSKTAAKAFAQKMAEIEQFCHDNGIHQSRTGDSYYFYMNGKQYRVSNHSVEASNSRAYDALGNQVREKYHADERNAETVYIHASKTRIIEIYTDLMNGWKLDGHGNRVKKGN